MEMTFAFHAACYVKSLWLQAKIPYKIWMINCFPQQFKKSLLFIFHSGKFDACHTLLLSLSQQIDFSEK